MDELANAVGQWAGQWVVLLLGALITFVTEAGKKLSVVFEGAHPLVKIVVVALFGQGATWVTATTGIVVTGDPSTLGTTLAGLVTSLVAMGLYSGMKALSPKAG